MRLMLQIGRACPWILRCLTSASQAAKTFCWVVAAKPPTGSTRSKGDLPLWPNRMCGLVRQAHRDRMPKLQLRPAGSQNPELVLGRRGQVATSGCVTAVVFNG